MKRHNWAECREPYKTELNTLASHWIEGELSHESLAFEILKVQSEIDDIDIALEDKTTPRLDDVRSQLKILAEAMLSASLDLSLTPSQRRQALDFIRDHDGPPRGNHR